MSVTYRPDLTAELIAFSAWLNPSAEPVVESKDFVIQSHLPKIEFASMTANNCSK
jgi:hypothetical protein